MGHLMRPTRIQSASLVLLSFVLAGIGIIWWLRSQRETTLVQLRNVGSDPIYNVSVFFSNGPLCTVADVLRENSKQEISCFPEVESGVFLEYYLESKEKVVLDCGGYFGPGIRAKISIEVDDNRVVKREITYAQSVPK